MGGAGTPRPPMGVPAGRGLTRSLSAGVNSKVAKSPYRTPIPAKPLPPPPGALSASASGVRPPRTPSPNNSPSQHPNPPNALQKVFREQCLWSSLLPIEQACSLTNTRICSLRISPPVVADPSGYPTGHPCHHNLHHNRLHGHLRRQGEEGVLPCLPLNNHHHNSLSVCRQRVLK